jgi:hypothetical protein
MKVLLRCHTRECGNRHIADFYKQSTFKGRHFANC